MIVYRVETVNGKGPYIEGNAPKILYDASTHPACRNDELPGCNNYKKLEDKHYWGFRTIEQLHDWFHYIYDKFERRSYVVAIYNVSKDYVLEFKSQLVFEKDKSELQETFRINNFFEAFSGEHQLYLNLPNTKITGILKP